MSSPQDPTFPLLSDGRFERLTDKLSEMTADLEAGQEWPDAQFDLLADYDVLAWVIPRESGGLEFSSADLLQGYMHLAEACLATTFVLTQRNGACQRIAASDNGELKGELLPQLREGKLFATVGISHLTTSRQHLGKPAVRVQTKGDSLILDGVVPWVTGAKFADYIVTGGTLEDGRQILTAVPTDVSGVSIDDPARLMALNASQTSMVRLDHVEIDRHLLIAGPVSGVMSHGASGTGSLTTSSLALGAVSRSIKSLARDAERRPELQEIHEPMAAELAAISDDMLTAARTDVSRSHEDVARTMETIRTRANSLVVRAAEAHLAASKGAGFVSGHPAERAVRESMFFLVWSCPQPVLAATLREFACV